MRLTEADLVRQLRDYLNLFRPLGLYYRRNIGGLRGQTGALDFYIWMPPAAVSYASRGMEGRGFFLALECKGPKGRVSKEQEAEIEALRASGHRAEVVRSLDEVMALLPYPRMVALR